MQTGARRADLPTTTKFNSSHLLQFHLLGGLSAWWALRAYFPWRARRAHLPNGGSPNPPSNDHEIQKFTLRQLDVSCGLPAGWARQADLSKRARRAHLTNGGSPSPPSNDHQIQQFTLWQFDVLCGLQAVGSASPLPKEGSPSPPYKWGLAEPTFQRPKSTVHIVAI